MDVARYPELWRDSPEGVGTASLWRWTIDLAAGRVDERQLDDRAIEFPRADDRRSGLRHRYGYAAANVFEGDDDRTQSCALVKYDLQTGGATAHEFGLGRTPSEGTFVPASARAGEDEGWVVQYVYDAARDATRLRHPRRLRHPQGAGRRRASALPRAVRLSRQLDRRLKIHHRGAQRSHRGSAPSWRSSQRLRSRPPA